MALGQTGSFKVNVTLLKLYNINRKRKVRRGKFRFFWCKTSKSTELLRVSASKKMAT